MLKTARGMPTWAQKTCTCYPKCVHVLVDHINVEWNGIDFLKYADVCRRYAVKGKKVTRRKFIRKLGGRPEGVFGKYVLPFAVLPGNVLVVFSVRHNHLIYLDIFTKVSNKIKQAKIYPAGDEFYAYNVPARFIAPYTPGMY